MKKLEIGIAANTQTGPAGQRMDMRSTRDVDATRDLANHTLKKGRRAPRHASPSE